MTEALKEQTYWEGVGRRKTAVARIRIWQDKKGSFVVNQKPLDSYFQDSEFQKIAKEPLEKTALDNAFSVSVVLVGGGVTAQAEAVRHGISRALVEFDAALRPQLKALHFLTRDPRMRERKKFGLKRARRARQWRKR